MPSKTDSVALLDVADTVVRAEAARLHEPGFNASPMATPKKIGFVNLGCPKNLVDSEVMMGLLSQGGAQILIVAGCLVERYRNEIQKNIPEVDAVVGTGELQKILSAAGIAPPSPVGSPFVILKSRSEGDAREAAGRFSKEEWDGAIADLPNYLYDENTPRVLATPKYSAYIKIAEGCDHPCSFCIIPQLRGKFRS